MDHEKQNNENKEHHGCCGGSGKNGFNWSRPLMIVLIGTALFFLLTEHEGIFFRLAPFLLLLACPLMHIFHGRRHGKIDNPKK